MQPYSTLLLCTPLLLLSTCPSSAPPTLTALYPVPQSTKATILWNLVKWDSGSSPNSSLPATPLALHLDIFVFCMLYLTLCALYIYTCIFLTFYLPFLLQQTNQSTPPPPSPSAPHLNEHFKPFIYPLLTRLS